VLGLACAIAATPVRSAAAASQDVPLTMAGITQATLGASQITPDGARCGLDPAHLVEAVRQPMLDAGFEPRDDAPGRVTLSAVTAQLPGGPQLPGGQCATAVLLGVYARESFFSAAAGWLRTGHVVLWQRSVMVVTPLGEHKAAVDDGARRLAVQMLASWQEQNAAGVAVAAGAAAQPPKPRP